MHGFCFSQIGEQLTILHPDAGTDFYLFLSDYARDLGVNAIAMSKDDMKFGKLGTKDLLRYGFNVIVVDPVYSPIQDEDIIPVGVHRNIETLHKYYPDCIVIGEIIPYFHKRRRLQTIKSYFQEGQASVIMDVLTSGWVVKSTTGNSQQINSRVYEYVKERDYELENSNAKRKTRRS
ncbi:hypothetical protein HOS86_gp020 [Klebsiella phage vB_KpnM_KpS110]|uniref:Uncharacterized protein n=1 Tax=Klebsiella phage vB_KpnM_KpS110 TaxID=2079262 RepID=A0A2K9VAA6_9CAUD|nr:hypothetical protein HOS86_gp020 [Klebsiella phage vB_KpnM_KpS110]AUV59136.1 hypothetical protein kps110_020 [Klebsiella phage vB_KpnM_KpS110]